METRKIHFKSLEEEMEFWDKHDSTKFEAEEVTAEEIITELAQQQKMKQVTLRLENELIDYLKALAAKRQMSYSALVRQLLWKEVQEISRTP
ncbi:ribbon-helix-helix protein, CopG family [Candidatus Poribacteria bacterium]|nr:ribbon-helix-helix protein, CopG family [Candidatus Poribacteria bacterium]